METLTTDQLVEAMRHNERFVLINVLSEEEFKKSHIPGSINIPLNQTDFIHAVEEAVGDNDAQVVVYCADADCSASPQAARQLEGAGFTNVYDYEGGMDAWREADNQVAWA